MTIEFNQRFFKKSIDRFTIFLFSVNINFQIWLKITFWENPHNLVVIYCSIYVVIDLPC